jgi:uncharacterized RDD family membrane protein YckC
MINNSEKQNLGFDRLTCSDSIISSPCYDRRKKVEFCHKCGAEVALDDLFCSKCGAQKKAASPAGREGVRSSIDSGINSDIGLQPTIQKLDYKGVGIRFIAQVIDGVICLIIFGILVSTMSSMLGTTSPDGFELVGTPAVIAQALTVFFSIIYFSLLEAYWGGQTLGKKVTGIQVVNEDGSAIDLGTAFIRNIIRPIDAFCVYLVAAVSIWLSPRKQRIGDRVARTCVVKKQSVPGNKTKKVRKAKFTTKDNVFVSDID